MSVFLSRKYICQDLRKWVGRVEHLLTQIYNTKAYVCVSVCPRVGKTESLGLWSIVYCFKLPFCQNDHPMGQSFSQKESLLQYTMNLLKGPKDPILHTLVSVYSEKINIFLLFSSPYQKGKKMVAGHSYL